MKFRISVCACLVAISMPAMATENNYQRKFGDWLAVVTADPMTDEKRCAAVYTKPVKAKSVLYTGKDAFKIDFKGYGGISMFRYRFGKSVPSEFESVIDADNNVITVPVFVSEALDASSLRVSGESVLRTSVGLDISLKGLKAARNDLALRCSMPDLPSINGGAPDWAVWQATPKD